MPASVVLRTMILQRRLALFLLCRAMASSSFSPPTFFIGVDLSSAKQRHPGGALGTTATTTTALSATVLDGKEIILESIADGRLVKLNQALLSFNSSAAADLLVELQSIRDEQQQQQPPPPPQQGRRSNVDEVLAELLAQGPDRRRRFSLWSAVFLRPRYSQRARLARLARTLDLTTPPPAQQGDGDDGNDTAESQGRRRQRALLSLLRTLAQPAEAGGFVLPKNDTGSKIPAICIVEKRAAAELKAASVESLVSRRPTDLETPAYAVLQQLRRRAGENGGVEIRRYEPYAVCTVSMNQSWQQRPVDLRTDAALAEPAKGGVKAFGALAGYLFGKNDASTAMKMTTPVLMTTTNTAMTTTDTTDNSSTTSTSSGSSGNIRQMSFILPSAYWNGGGGGLAAPAPLEGSGVSIAQVAGETRAARPFGGYANRVAERQQALLDRLRNDKEWEVVPGAMPVLAQYNDPFTPPWKRLNEVSVAVRPRSASASTAPTVM